MAFLAPYIAGLVLLLLLLVSAGFSGSETILFSLTAHDRTRLRQSPNRLDAMAAGLLDDPRALITTLMIGNMGCNILIFVISAQLLAALQSRAGMGITAVLALLPSLVVTYVSDVLPKVLGSRNNVRLAPLVALPVATLVKSARPLCRLIDRGILQPAHRVIAPGSLGGGAEGGGRVTVFSPLDMAEMLEMSREQGVIDVSENELLQEVVRIGELQVRDVMRPRVDVIAYDINDPPEKLLELFRQSHLTKLPVYDGQIDNLIGLVYAKEVLLSLGTGGMAKTPDAKSPPPPPLDIRRFIRQLHFVPEFQSLDRLIARFRQTRTQWAAVVDEYGGFVGLITLEDVVEQMVGEIYEPHDKPREMVQSLAPDEYRVAGDIAIMDWEEAFDVSRVRLAELHQRTSTLAGLLASLLKRIPKPGDQVRLGHLIMTVETMRGRRVEFVRLKLVDHHALSAGMLDAMTSNAPEVPPTTGSSTGQGGGT